MARRISQDEWEQNKSKIHELYVLQDLPLVAAERPEGLIEQMRRIHGFDATFAQYRRQFKEWAPDFDKNIDANIWKIVAHKVGKRKRAEKDSVVSINKKRIPAKRLRKEIQRYGYDEAFSCGGQEAQSPRTPENLVIGTPRYRENRILDLIKNVPWFCFNSNLLRCLKEGSMTAFAVHNQHQIEQSTRRFMFEAKSFMESISEAIDEDDNRDAHASHIDLNAMFQFDRNTQFFSHVVYALTNNLVRADERENMMNYLLHQDKQRLLRKLLATKTTTNSVLLGKIYHHAVLTRDKSLVLRCLHASVNPDLRFSRNDSQYISSFVRPGGLDYKIRYPLQYLCGYGDLDIIKCLVDHGSDVNAHAHSTYPPFMTALEIAVFHQRTDVALFLIGANAKVNGSNALHQAVRTGNNAMISLLFDHGAEIDAYSSMQFELCELDALQAAALYGHSSTVDLLLRLGARAHAKAARFGMTALSAAAKSGASMVMRSILDALLLDNMVLDEEPDEENFYRRTALQIAVEANSIDIVKQLLSAGCSIDFRCSPTPGDRKQDTDSRTPLQIAMERQNDKMVVLLIDAGADINADPGGPGSYTVLQSAVEWGNFETIELLLHRQAKLDPSEGIPSRCSTLRIAARGGSTEIVDLLIRHGADIFARSREDNGSALDSAASFGHLEVVKLLISYGADGNDAYASNLATALSEAARGGHLHIIAELLNAGAKPASAILSAVEGDQTESFNLLLRACLTTKDYGLPHDLNEALFVAARCDNRTMAHDLVKVGAELNVTTNSRRHRFRFDCTPLQVAAFKNHKQMVQDLLALGADVHSVIDCGTTALAAAAGAGNIDVVRLLLESGAHVEGSRAYGRTDNAGRHERSLSATPLQEAAYGNHAAVIDLLLDAGANFDTAPAIIRWERYYEVEPCIKSTCLHSAAMNENERLVRKLLAFYTDSGQRIPTFGISRILKTASFWTDHDMFRLLLRAGASLNASPAELDSTTALQDAVNRGRLDVVLLLLEAGADPNVCAEFPDDEQDHIHWGESPLEIAAQKGRVDIVPLLLNAGAKTEGAAEVALNAGYEAIANLIKRHERRAGVDVGERLSPMDGTSPRETSSEHGEFVQMGFVESEEIWGD